MSLVNDALKRARKLAPPDRPAAGPRPGRLVAANESGASGSFWVVILLLAVLAVSGSLLYQWFRVGNVLVVRSRQAPQKLSVTAAPVVNPPVPIAPATPTPLVPSSISQSNAVAAPPATEAKALAVEIPKPVPPLYKLEAVFYRPASPEAVINGKTVAVGDKLGEAVVQAITSESVSLLTADGKTTVLVLP